MAQPSHLFACHDGGLYDTRRPDWSSLPPLRPNWAKSAREIPTCDALKAALRAGEYAWPGGYQMYFITTDGGVLSFASVRENLREILDAIQSAAHRSGWRVAACEVNYEDSELRCDHSGELIPAAYGSH